MGGLGSGRWNWHRKKGRAEACHWFTVAVLVGDLPPAAGRSGRLKWVDQGGTETASFGFAFTAPHTVAVTYRWGREPKDYAYPLTLVPVPTPNGGTRYLAACPLTVDGVKCRRRAAKLYRPPHSPWFGCRHCHQLTYRSRQAHDPRISALLRGGLDRLTELAEDPSALPIPMLGRVLFAFEEWRYRSDKAMKRLDPKPPPRRRKKK